MNRSKLFETRSFVRKKGWLLAFSFCGAACSGPLADAPNIVVPLPGESEPAPVKQKSEEPAPAEPPKAAVTLDALGAAPDPEALPSRAWFEVVVRYEKGKASLLSARRVELEAERLPERRVGRFAVELFVGRQLVERVRFEFPLLADERDGFESGLTAEAKVFVPDHPDARGARLLDRKTGSIVELTEALWPREKRTEVDVKPE